MERWAYRPGDAWAFCDRCGFRRWHSQLRREWTGLMVCGDTCFEERHPQEFRKAIREKITFPNARPEQTDVFLDTNDITADSL